MTTYPLFMNHRLPLAGNGFWAAISLRARVLLREESASEIYVYGVNPGGICGTGTNRDAAMAAFWKRFLSVMLDVAEEAKSFEEFKAEIESALNETNEEYEMLWNEAVQNVRDGKVNLTGVICQQADLGHSIKIEESSKPIPALNPSEEVVLAGPKRGAA